MFNASRPRLRGADYTGTQFVVISPLENVIGHPLDTISWVLRHTRKEEALSLPGIH